MQETQVQSQDQEDPLEKEMATHSSILSWEIPQTEEPGGLQFMGSQKSWSQLSTKQQLGCKCYSEEKLQTYIYVKNMIDEF